MPYAGQLASFVIGLHESLGANGVLSNGISSSVTEMNRHKLKEAGAGAITTILSLVYVGLGFLVASRNDYLDRLGSIRRIISLVLAILLWPLVLLGVDFHLGGK